MVLIRLKNIEWKLFDCFYIYSGHMKTDQFGEEAKYPRHLYCNPTDPFVCPGVALACYLSLCFGTGKSANSKLFPGTCQYDRFSKLLERELSDHSREVYEEFGFFYSDIGTHSIQKGAILYVASQQGGPSGAAICICAGWSMGKVRDIYMRFVESGDHFVGRCMSMLPLSSTNFGMSPPHFSDSVSEEKWTTFVNVVRRKRKRSSS